jgi:hypothetical protein
MHFCQSTGERRGLELFILPDDEKRRSHEEVPERVQEQRRPFDSREIENIPKPRDDDPPYRPWWVAHDDED